MYIPAGYDEQITTPQDRRGVETFWSFMPQSSGCAIILPDGRSDIIFRFEVNPNSTVIGRLTPALTGPATAPYEIEYQRGEAWMGIRMRPSNTSRIWGGRIARAKDNVLRGREATAALLPALMDLREVFDGPKAARAALERLCPASDNAAPVVEDALRQIHLSGGRARISDIALRLSLSPRHLGRLFFARVGLSPKRYAGIVRFHRALRLLRDHGLSASAAAFEAGYADQAHLGRSFQRYGGFSPGNIPTNLNLPGFSRQI